MRVAIVVLLVAGCGGGDGSTNAPVVDQPASTPGPTLAETCADVGTAACNRNAECAATIGAIAPEQTGEFAADCEAGYRLSLDCSRVTQLTGHPDVCMADYMAEPCGLYVDPTGLPVPASCKHIFR